jgi:hypothetical protein
MAVYRGCEALIGTFPCVAPLPGLRRPHGSCSVFHETNKDQPWLMRGIRCCTS